MLWGVCLICRQLAGKTGSGGFGGTGLPHDAIIIIFTN